MPPRSSDCILVIAPRIPCHDRNSGDLRLFSLLKMLTRTYQVYFLSASPPGSPGYIGDLEGLGVSVLPNRSSLAALLLRVRLKAAIIEFYYIAEYYLPRVKLLQPRCRVIVDTVDVHFLREDMQANVTGDAAALARAAGTKARELSVYSRADLVVAVTEDDGLALQKECASVTVRVIPNVHQVVLSAPSSSGPTLIFVGGFRHSPNVDAMLYFCREVLPLILKDVPDVRLSIVGSDPPPEIQALGGERITVTGFVPSTTPYLHASRVSVAPLRFGAGMKGKVGEAMAHGVPVVTTTVGAQGMGLQHGVHVLIADGQAPFAAAVVSLLGDARLHDRLRRNAVDHVVRHYTPVTVAGRLDSILRELDRLPVRALSTSEKIRFLARWSRVRIEKLLQRRVV